MTQILYYLGELPASGGQAAMDLDLAKHHLDVLTILEEKTKNNLTPEEQSMIDAALYETRTRFVNVASQLLGP
jgi:predicted kinase